MYRIQARISNKATLPAFLGRKPSTHHFIGRKAVLSSRRRY
jgi:hypothetical protein